MYSTCLFCHSSLGANESIEHFPVGRRLAFDSAKGRLWIVCRKCARWNLSPLEERWEAIEEAERAYRDTRKRVSTNNIGLARLKDGTDLVRIGKPMLPEFAAWRYGDQIGRRRRNRIALGVGATATGGSIAAGIGFGVASIAGPALLLSFASIAAMQSYKYWLFGFRRLTVATSNGELLQLTTHNLDFGIISLNATNAVEPKILHLSIRHLIPRKSQVLPFLPRKLETDINERFARAEFEDAEAERVLCAILSATNGFSGSEQNVTAAVDRIERAPSARELLDTMSDADKAKSRKRVLTPSANILLIKELPAPLRLALEMSLNEESERRALNGELAELENRWKQAEEIAAISDGLFITKNTEEKIREMHD